MPGQRYSVAIIGAGPTGLTLANLLGIYGVGCLLVERNAATVHEPRAVSIDDESLRTMQATGLAAEVMSETVAGFGSHYYSARGRLFATVQPHCKALRLSPPQRLPPAGPRAAIARRPGTLSARHRALRN